MQKRLITIFIIQFFLNFDYGLIAAKENIEPYNCFILEFEGFKPEQDNAVRAKILRVCNIPVGVINWSFSENDPGPFIQVCINKAYGGIVKEDSKWFINSKNEILLGYKGDGPSILPYSKIKINQLLSEKKFLNYINKPCGIMTSVNLEKIVAVEKTATEFADAFKKKEVELFDNFFHDENPIKVIIKHSINEYEELLTFRNETAFIEWFKDLGFDTNNAMKNMEVRTLSSCTQEGCDFAINHGINHNSLYLTKLNVKFVKNKPFINQVEILSGD